MITPARPHAHQLPAKSVLSQIRTVTAILLVLTCFLHPTRVAAIGLNPTNNSSPAALDSWPFSDTNWLTHFSNAPISFTNLVNVPDLGDGNCLLLDSTNAAWLQYSTTQNGTNRLKVSEGTVLFWFASSWSGTNAGGTGPGQWGRLVEAGAYTTNASYGWWSLFLDPEGSHVFFASQTNDGSGATYLSAPVTLTTNRWHLFALTYSQTNSSFYFDSDLVTNGLPLAYLPPAEVVSNGFYIGSDNTGLDQARGMFDNFSTYDHVLDADAIAQAFLDSSIFYLNVLNKANSFSSAPSTPGPMTPSFNAITGPGYLTPVSTNSTCATNSHIWITNFSIISMTGGSNGHATVRFQIAGGQNNVLYDVFANSILSPASSTNAWAWMGQGRPCVTYQITNFPTTSAFVILGTPQDSDNDGLTDAYELLVSKTDPNNPDSDGSGLADWWQIVNFGQTGVDPYGDPDGDGLSNLQEYYYGTNPHTFETPPPPSAFTANLINDGASVCLSWLPSPGPLTGYSIARINPYEGTYTTLATVAPTATSWTNTSGFVYTLGIWPARGPDIQASTYRLQAVYPGGASEPSYAQPSSTNAPYSVSASLIRGPTGRWQLAFAPWSKDVQTLRLIWVNWKQHRGSTPVTTNQIISLTSITNGYYMIPDADALTHLGFAICVQGIGPQGKLGQPINAGVLAGDAPCFVDGRQHMNENLMFRLRAATLAQPCPLGSWYDIPTSTNYVECGFLHWAEDDYTLDNYIQLNDLWPFTANYQLHQRLYDTNDVPSDFIWQTNLVTVPAPAVLGLSDPYWIDQDFGDLADLATSESGTYPNQYLSLQSGAHNLFGLSVETALINRLYFLDHNTGLPYDDPGFTIDPGTTVLLSTNYSSIVAFRSQAAAPTFSTLSYYFAPVTSPGFDWADDTSQQAEHEPYPLPVNLGFKVTNTTPLMIASANRPFLIGGWAKEQIVNGSSTKFGYLGQYFDKAYKIGTNGIATTNETGVLSPYGDFFPTEPGPVALVTMTNWGVNERGTGIVNVIKLQLDVNHDGLMDTSFAGPDNTSQQRPFVFWVNNDHDEPGSGGKPDMDISARGVHPQMPPDYTYGAISCQRNLEDFARLWFCGLPAIPLFEGPTVTLSIRNVTGSPAINLYPATETEGGTWYLTQTDIAANQVDTGGKTLGTISNNCAYTLTGIDGFYAGTKHFLFEGAGVGTGELVLRVLDITDTATNVLAESSVWLDLRDVTSMYEQARVVGVSPTAPDSSTASFTNILTLPPSTTEAPQLTLFVHGWRMGVWDYESFSSTMFKRLYWQGYQGRFASLRWPTLSADDFNFPSPAAAAVSLTTYNASEFIAFESGSGMALYLTWLRARFPDYLIGIAAHSMGNIVTAQALRLQSLAGIHSADNYVLMQAAVPANCYDTNYANYAPFLTAEGTSHTPDVYRGYPGNIAAALDGSILNFFNTNDFALATGFVTNLSRAISWEANEVTYKPNSSSRYSSDGTNCFQSISFLQYRTITDAREKMAFVARPRSQAVGAAAGVNGVIQGTQVDLKGSFGFDRGIREHSAQFNWNLQNTAGFYGTLLNRLFPPQ